MLDPLDRTWTGYEELRYTPIKTVCNRYLLPHTLTQKLGNKTQWLFHDQFKFSVIKKCLKSSLWGYTFAWWQLEKVSNFHTKYLDQNMNFNDFSTTSAICPKIHDFSRPAKFIFKFHDLSWLFTVVWTLLTSSRRFLGTITTKHLEENPSNQDHWVHRNRSQLGDKSFMSVLGF